MDWTDDRPLTHPGAQHLTAEMVSGLKGRAFVRQRRRIIFVCGGAPDPAKPTQRSAFLDWATRSIGDGALLLLSEVAYRAALEHNSKFVNIAAFEEILASVSDCILVFPESAGSFSEIGIFATSDTIRAKTLIANDSSHETHDSFLTLGPIQAINQVSLFTPSVNFDSRLGVDPTFHSRIWIRIKERTPHHGKRRRPAIKHFVVMSLSDQVAIICWILQTTGIAKFGDLLDILRSTYGQHDKDARVLRQTLTLLVALEQITRPAEDLYRTKPKPEFSLEVRGKTAKLSAQFRGFWLKEFPDLWSY